jgi:hypothetical protein
MVLKLKVNFDIPSQNNLELDWEKGTKKGRGQI